MNYDPYNNTQTRFERTDPTGRWSPIHEPTNEAWWVPIVGGLLMSCVLAIMAWWAL